MLSAGMDLPNSRASTCNLVSVPIKTRVNTAVDGHRKLNRLDEDHCGSPRSVLRSHRIEASDSSESSDLSMSSNGDIMPADLVSRVHFGKQSAPVLIFLRRSAGRLLSWQSCPLQSTKRLTSDVAQRTEVEPSA